MTQYSMRLLLDEMLGDRVAEQLRGNGYDVLAVVADSTLIGLPDATVLDRASRAGRAVVTRNIKDFVALDAQYRSDGRTHAGLVLVATKSFPENRGAVGALARSLQRLLSEGGVEAGGVMFLPPSGP